MKILSRLRRDTRATAAVEMALIAPVIAGLALASLTIWQTAARIEDMRLGLMAGSRYYMGGGSDDTAARTLMMSAWQHAPNDANVSIQRICKCGTTVSQCGVICLDNTPPSIFVNLTAAGTGANGVTTFPLNETKVVRVR